MNHIESLSSRLERFVETTGKLASWCLVLLVVIIIFDVITRRFLVLGSTKLQELEWHLHTILFCLTLGYGYLHDAHVRVDLVRERLSRRLQAAIEVAGIALLLMPFVLLMIYYTTDFAYRAYVEGEVSAAGTGLPYRWIIKSVIPIGFVVLLLSAIARLLTSIRDLIRPHRDPDSQSPDAHAGTPGPETEK